MATGLKDRPVDSIIEQFWGDIKKWPTKPEGINYWHQPLIRKVAEHMSATGDCLWHAMFVVEGSTKCHCAKCSPGPLTKGVAK